MNITLVIACAWGYIPLFFNYMNILQYFTSEGRSLMVSESRMLKSIFHSKNNEITVEWRRLHDDELTDLNC